MLERVVYRRGIRPKKEYMKSYETYFANTLNFLIRVQAGMTLFPKVLWPFNYLTLTQNKPLEFFDCYLLFDHYCLTMIEL